jgi:GT2 family glycosyltransferase
MLSTFIICTRNRPDDLLACVRSIITQTVLPDELIIIDASHAAVANQSHAQVSALVQDTPIQFYYQPSSRNSLPFQRNLGIDLASGEVLFFLDDDVVLLPDFLCTMRRLHQTYQDQEVGGIQGIAINMRPSSLKYRVFRQIFLPYCNRQRLAQVVHPSGDAYVDHTIDQDEVAEVQWMIGYCMSFQRQVFDHFRFDDCLEGYAAAEDLDFTYRVSQKYRLLRASSARVIHTTSPVGRARLDQLAEMRIVNRHYLFRKNMPQHPLQRLAYAWGSLGQGLFALGLALKYRDLGYLVGTARGVGRILRGDLPHVQPAKLEMVR